MLPPLVLRGSMDILELAGGKNVNDWLDGWWVLGEKEKGKEEGMDGTTEVTQLSRGGG